MVNTNLRLQRPPTRTKHRPNDPKPEHRSRVRAQKQPRSTRTRIGLFLEVFQQSLVEAPLRRKTSGEAKGPAAATATRPPSGHKCVRAVSSAAAGADSYLSRCSRCPGAILHRVPSHKSHRSLRRVSRQINALRSQLRRFPLSTGNTGAQAPRAQPVANKAGGSGGAPAGNNELCVCLCRQLRTCAVKPQRAPLFPNLSKIKRR